VPSIAAANRRAARSVYRAARNACRCFSAPARAPHGDISIPSLRAFSPDFFVDRLRSPSYDPSQMYIAILTHRRIHV
jgi:hypothetical protein